jgi:hypothetical protein
VGLICAAAAALRMLPSAPHSSVSRTSISASAAGDSAPGTPRLRLVQLEEMSDFAATDLKFQSNLVRDSIKPISNFCFQILAKENL